MQNTESEQTAGIQRPSLCVPGPRRVTMERTRSRAAERVLDPLKSLSLSPQPSWFLAAQKPERKWKQSKNVQRVHKPLRLIRAGLEALLLLPPLTRSAKVSAHSSIPSLSRYFNASARFDPELEQTQGWKRREGCTTYTWLREFKLC